MIALRVPPWCVLLAAPVVLPGCGTPPPGPSGANCTVTSIQISSPSSPATALVVGETRALTATPVYHGACDAAELAITWSSSDPSKATVVEGPSNTAIVTAVAPTVSPPLVTITAGGGGTSESRSFAVSTGPVVSIQVTPGTPTVVVGSSLDLGVNFLNQFGAATTGTAAQVQWTAPPSAAATISASGRVTGLAPGSLVVTATYTGVNPNPVATATITVVAPAASITVSPGSASVAVGGTVQLSAAVKDAGGAVLTGRGVTWQSLNPAVASVGAVTGLVTGIAAGGPVIIRARADENQSVLGDASVTVTGVACNNPTVIADDFSTDLGAGWTTTFESTHQFNTHDLAYQATGGNPGGYRRMVNHLVGVGTIAIFHLREVEYDPGLPGNAIDHINYSEDQIEFLPPAPGAQVGWGFFLLQGGTRYLKSLGTAAYGSLTWSPVTIPNMTGADWPGANLGSTGGKIKFGFYRSNTSTGGIYDITHGIDNWRVEICKR